MYSRIYKDLGTEDKYRRKKIKEAMKDTPGQISEAVYKSLYPEKKMRFIEKEEEKEKWRKGLKDGLFIMLKCLSI